MNSEDIKQVYPNISEILDNDSILGLKFCSKGTFKLNNELNSLKGLKYYYSDQHTKEIITHNLKWALSKEKKPKFQFIYILLPTNCNQKCYGCFTGKDLETFPVKSSDTFYSKKELDNILEFALEHDVKAVVYGGSGELFTWHGSIDYIKNIHKRGLKSVIFTNGSLLDENKLKILNDLEAALIISIRDTNEHNHNLLVGVNNFKTVLKNIDTAISLGFSENNRLAIEIPATTDNESRIINDLLPCLRHKNVIPMIEEFLQPKNCDKTYSAHNFTESRTFFNNLVCMDNTLGYKWLPELGTRVLGQPKCERPLFSFTVLPNRDIADCPAGFKVFGNIKDEAIQNIIYSSKYKSQITDFKFCACSVFYSDNDKDIPVEQKAIYT